MSIVKRRNKWWIDFGHRGRRYRLVSPDNSKAGAKAYEALLRQRLASGLPLQPQVIKKSLKFKDFAEKWFESYVKLNNKPSAIKGKKTDLYSALVPYFGSKRLNEITALDIEEFKSKRLKKVKPKTVNTQVGNLMKCLRTAVDWGELDKIPITKPLKTDPPDFDFLSEEEAKRLLDASSGYYYTAILLALHTGMRFGELMALDWKNVKFHHKLIEVKHSFSNGVMTSPKSNKIRQIPMTRDLFDHLIKQEDKEGFVLKGPDKIRFRPECSRTTLKEICKKANLRPIGWHKLRHTFASRLAEKNVSMAAVQILMGHSDIRTTMRYAHLGEHILREAVTALESPQKMNLRHNSVTPENLEVSKSQYSKLQNTL
jgi:integrase